MNNRIAAGLTVAVALLVLTAAPSAGEDGKFQLGLRDNVVTGDGKPSNDIPGYGLIGRYKWKENWLIGVGVDHSSKFDVERAPDLVGLTTPEVIDAEGSSTEFSVFLERVYPRPDDTWEWFWSGGLGFNDVDVDPVMSPFVTQDFNIETDAGSETVLKAHGGVRRWLGERWGLEATLRADYHLADWTLRDVVSGATGSIDDYLVKGISLGVVTRF